jgi:hypothetical protein
MSDELNYEDMWYTLKYRLEDDKSESDAKIATYWENHCMGEFQREVELNAKIEYAISEMEDVKELYQEKMEKKKEKAPIFGKNAKTIRLSEQPNYFYEVSSMNNCHYNEVLKKNGKDPEWLRLALEDDNVLNEFMKLTRDMNWGGKEPVGELSRNKYDIIINDYMGGFHVIEFFDEHRTSFTSIDNFFSFLDEEMAKEQLATEVREEIENYFDTHKDKTFEEADK